MGILGPPTPLFCGRGQEVEGVASASDWSSQEVGVATPSDWSSQEVEGMATPTLYDVIFPRWR